MLHNSPIAGISFEKCDNDFEMKRVNHPVIKNLRSKDIFRDLRSVEYDTVGRVVDTAYWTTKLINSSLDLSSYGLRYKKDFVMTSFSQDSFVIDHTEVYREALKTDVPTFNSSQKNYLSSQTTDKSKGKYAPKKAVNKPLRKKWLIWW